MFQIPSTAEEISLAKTFLHQAVPVSFTYHGKKFPEGFSGADGVYISEDKTCLCEFPMETFEGSSALEWLPVFSCVSEEKTDQIKDVKVLDYTFAADGEAELYYANGTRARIDDFELRKQNITGAAFIIASNGSRDVLPFFNLKTGSGGVIFGLGFTADWKAEFVRVNTGIHVTVSMSATDFYLLPREKVRNIRMLAIFWKGELSRSFNMLRNHLVLHYIPSDENGEPYPPICCMSWGGMKTENHLKYIRFLKDNHLNFDCYWMDAGWHGPDHETDEFQDLRYEEWAYNQGDWSVNRCAHPDGLKPVSDAAHDHNMKFLLWFGTYVCAHGIGWHKEHPEWGDNRSAEHGIGANQARKTILHMINFNCPEARRYIIDEVCKTIDENGVDCYREDTPPVYGGNDDEGRVGINEMKAVQYLYDYWDELRTRFQGLLIDNCGGGGSHIDLETLKRSYVFWRSDYNCFPDSDPIGAQVGNYGLGHFVPLVNGAAPLHPGVSYHFHSGLYGGMGFGLFHIVGMGDAEKHTWFAKDYPVEWHKKMIDQYQTAKPYLSGNFYPLTGCSTNTDDVMSYQFERPDLRSGLIFGFFRQDCTETELSVNPVLEDGCYSFENLDTGETFELAVKGGATVTIRADGKPHSTLLLYRKTDDFSETVK